LVVGLGDSGKFDLTCVRKAAAVSVQAVGALQGAKRIATITHGAGIGGLDIEAAAKATAEGCCLAAYQPPQYVREQAEPKVESCVIVEFDSAKIDAVTAGATAGQHVADGVYSARNYVSDPGNILYPEEFAKRARKMADEVGLDCTILDEAQMRELGMNILLAVSAGSEREAQMIILEHAPNGTENDPPLLLVGKGITFDTGGISLKQPHGQERRNYQHRR